MNHEQLELDNAVMKLVAANSTINHMRDSCLDDVEFHSFIEVDIHQQLKKTNLLFLIADSSEDQELFSFYNVAKIAKELGVLTISVVTVAPCFDDVASLTKVSDSLLLIRNKPVTAINNMQLYIVRSMSDAVTQQSLIGFDFADLKTLTKNNGLCTFGMGTAKGENRASKATQDVLSLLLSKNINVLQQAYGLLVNISGQNIGIEEFDTVGNLVSNLVSDDVVMKIAITHNKSLGDKVNVTIIVT